MKRRFLSYLFIASVIGAFFLWLAAKELPFETVGETFRAMETGHIVQWTLLFCALYSVCHLARVMRWYELLRSVGNVDRRAAYQICAVGFLAILILPLRLGEFVRPYLVGRRSDISASSALGTVVVERVLDGLVITGLLFATLTAYSATHEATLFATSLGLLGAAIFIPALCVCLLALWRRELSIKLVDLCFFWAPTVGAKVNDLLGSFIDGVGALRSGGTLLRFMGFTAVYWGFNGVSMYVLATFGFGFEMSVWDAFTLLAVLVIGIMLPAGPALAGNYEYFVGRGMSLFTDHTEYVAAFAASMHVLQFLVIVVPGIILLAMDRDARAAFQRAISSEEKSEDSTGNSAT